MMEKRFYSSAEKLETIVDRNRDLLSGQLCRRLTLLVESTVEAEIHRPENRMVIVRRILSVFHRLLLELIQAHYNTQQREREFLRLMKSKGCAIDMLDEVIEALVKLYKASQDYSKISFERNVLIRFVMKELKNDSNIEVKHIEKTIQTLYRCSCFDIVKKDNKNINELRLKADLCDAKELSMHCDSKLIAIAQEHQIRLNPESWAYLLHRNHPDVCRVQTVIDKCQRPPSTIELEETMTRVGDRYNISPYLLELKEVEDLLKTLIDSNSNIAVDIGYVCVLMEKLTHFEELCTLRQRRNACNYLSEIR